MPLSDFTWNLQTQQPVIHEVYPKKRKAPGFGDADRVVPSQNNNGEEMENNVWKRRCMEASGDDVMAEVNHNMSTSENLNIPSVQPSQPQGCWPLNPQSNSMFINPLVMTSAMQEDDECVPVVANMSSSQQVNFPTQQSIQDEQSHQQPFNDDCMIMNLNEETYSRTSGNIIEEQMAYSSMDSDGVPDPEQYKLEMCNSNCFDGERNQPSSKVKCYCRPSWEGLMEMRPYVSDYY
ncbi:uncharacterized protein LOC110455235 [Mizuhopecten yessoensis]|uniref:Uncharacterized protein n=1 Tax=Mizuhopecten yessoensis TaxID=6573 RepID=A0A210QDC0_MIZYE|nr:uncharacterized protein LOC110455235 [Mizuhopecten yessoensis]OWF46747.1 hypothetical protein KP79_PYT18858 [Mizuhopecten yessoensis]